MTDLQANAAELLELETLYQRGELTQEQSQRWRELAGAVFGSDDFVRTRRSFRLHAAVPAMVRIRRGTFPCTIHEVSRIGLALTGQVFAYVTHEDVLEIVSADVQGQTHQVDLKCTIVRFTGTPPQASDQSMVAVTIANDNSATDRQRFFDQVYYPLYLDHLRHLAGGR